MNRKWIHKWVLSPVAMCFVIYSMIRLLNDVATNMLFWERPWQTTLAEFAGGLLIVYALLIGFERLTKNFNQKTFSDAKKQIGFEVSWVAAYTLLVTNIIGPLLMIYTDNGMQPHDPIILNIVVLFFSLLLFVYGRANYYLQAYSDNQYKVEQLAREKVESELKFLKAQVNPHFLFNSINNIYHLIDENKAQARDVLERFSGLLRYQLYECNAPRVPLQKEVDYINNYIQLQKIRLPERLELSTCFPEHLSGIQIAPFLFLPLVENAFKYLGEPLRLDVKLSISDEWICFRVGNSVDQNEATVAGPSGIGLDNLNRRLELLYPEQHELTIDAGEDYFEVQLKVGRS